LKGDAMATTIKEMLELNAELLEDNKKSIKKAKNIFFKVKKNRKELLTELESDQQVLLKQREVFIKLLEFPIIQQTKFISSHQEMFSSILIATNKKK
jgi:hypothetical protein